MTCFPFLVLFLSHYSQKAGFSNRLIELVGKGEKTDAPQIEIAALNWGKEFLRCGSAPHGMRGFQQKNITPYAHWLMTHAAPLNARIGPLDKFSGETLEKWNDEFKKSHLRQTNCKSIITTLLMHKRWELARMNQDLYKLEKNAGKPVKLTCQVILLIFRQAIFVFVFEKSK